MRVCIFGETPPTVEWLAHVAHSAPDGTAICLLGACADAVFADARIERRGDIARRMTAQAVLPLAAAAYPGDNLVLLRAGTALPPLWFERLLRVR